MGRLYDIMIITFGGGDSMKDCLTVAAGGAIGAVLRYLAGKIPLGSQQGFPVKTFIVNIVGCIIIGFVAALALKQLSEYPRLVLFLKVGLCGGFTTFSSFALETGGLIGRGSYLTAAAYVILSTLLGVAAVFGAQFIVDRAF